MLIFYANPFNQGIINMCLTTIMINTGRWKKKVKKEQKINIYFTASAEKRIKRIFLYIQCSCLKKYNPMNVYTVVVNDQIYFEAQFI